MDQRGEIEVAGRVYLGREGRIRVAHMVPRFHFQEARALVVFVFDRELVAQVVGTWVCFSPAEGKLCNTKIGGFCFEQPLYL